MVGQDPAAEKVRQVPGHLLRAGRRGLMQPPGDDLKDRADDEVSHQVSGDGRGHVRRLQLAQS